MAGVYIKDAKLPDACWDCGWDPCMLWNEDRGDLPKHPNCPLVEVQDHGGLIDRDELIKKMVNTPIKALDGVDFDQAWFTRVSDTAIQFVDEVERQVAIIPADKEEV